ncbi:hypothetical protein ACXR0O_05500 [Verrucomicrobiota bacterium sgz303538]
MSFSTRDRVFLLLAGGAAAVVLGAAVYLHSSPQPAPSQATSPDRISGAASDGDRANSDQASSQETTSPQTDLRDPIQNSIEKLFSRLESGKATAAELEALRRELLSADPQRATAAIRAFLDSSRDALTRQEFTIGDGGTLAGAPTMRTFLLDLLGQISKKSHTDAAAVVSRQVLETKQSSDEWAVALRNVGWTDPRSKPYLAGKVREMLAYEPWASQPSAGFLEAFDVAVFSQDPAFIPDLSNLLRGGNPELQRAAAVALDRLSAMAPLVVMTYLNSNPSELADRPFLRADYYAKADLSNSEQRKALETYLARTDVSVAEKTKLVKALATPAAFVSENLLTPSPLADADDSPVREQQLNQLLTQWLTQNRYPELQGEMARVQQRIGK